MCARSSKNHSRSLSTGVNQGQRLCAFKVNLADKDVTRNDHSILADNACVFARVHHYAVIDQPAVLREQRSGGGLYRFVYRCGVTKLSQSVISFVFGGVG